MQYRIDEAKGRAEHLLSHYLSTAFRAAGLRWSEDNDVEVRIIIDSLAEMVDERVRDHAEEAPHLYQDGSQ